MKQGGCALWIAVELLLSRINQINQINFDTNYTGIQLYSTNVFNAFTSSPSISENTITHKDGGITFLNKTPF